MDIIGKSVTMKRKSTGETKTGTIVSVKVKLDTPIPINAAGYQDTITHVDLPGGNYEILEMSGGGPPSHVRNIFKAIRRSQGKTLKRSEPGARYLLPKFRFGSNVKENNTRKQVNPLNLSLDPNFHKLKRENKNYTRNLIQSRRPNSYTRYAPGRNFPPHKQYLYEKFAKATQGRNNVGSMMRAIRTMNLSEENRGRLEQRVLNLYGNINTKPSKNYNNDDNETRRLITNW